MANTTLNMQLLLRRDNIFTSTYVLEAGEPGFEISTNTFKIGDGTKTWAELPIANKAEIDALIKVTDDKLAGYTTTEAQLAIDKAQDDRLTELEKVDHDHANKAELDLIASGDKAKWDAAEAKAHTHSFNEAELNKIAEGDVEKWNNKADKSYVDDELAKKVNISDYDNDKTTFALKTDLTAYRTSADQDVIDQGLIDRIADLEAIDHDQLAADASAAAVATVLDGAPGKFDTLKEIAAWIAEADTAEDAASLVTRVAALEAIDHDAYVDADAKLKEELEGKINGINNHSHTFVESELNKIADGDVAKWNAEVGAKALAESKTTSAEVKTQIEAYGYATTGNVATAKREAIDAAKLYADGLEHKNTTYTVAPTANALEFTVTPSEGAAQTVTLVAPNTGVMEVEAGNDIVVTPGENGKVTVAHETFTTGEYTKDPATSDKTGDIYMMTAVTVDNGHVTGASVKSLAAALEGMTFIIDGGNSTN